MFMNPEYIVKEFLFQRNSPVARMELGQALLENYQHYLPRNLHYHDDHFHFPSNGTKASADDPFSLA